MKTPEQIARSEKYKKYYDKKRKPKRTPEEELEFKEKQRQHQNEYSKLHHKKTYVKRFVPKTEEEKKAKAKECAKRYYDKINVNRISKPRVKKEKKDVVSHRKEVIREVNYVNDIELLYYIKISLGQGKLHHNALIMLMKIPERVSRKFIYRNENDREDIISAGKLKLLESWSKFDCDKYSNCLAYYTELSKRAIAKEYNLLRGQNNSIGEIPKNISLSKWDQ